MNILFFFLYSPVLCYTSLPLPTYPPRPERARVYATLTLDAPVKCSQPDKRPRNPKAAAHLKSKAPSQSPVITRCSPTEPLLLSTQASVSQPPKDPHTDPAAQRQGFPDLRPNRFFPPRQSRTPKSKSTKPAQQQSAKNACPALHSQPSTLLLAHRALT
jgi:hypothetical protein